MVDFSFRLIRWLFFSFLLGNHKGFQVLGIDHSSVNLEFPEGIINFGAGELLTVDLSVNFESFEGSHNDIIVISSAGHLLCKEGDHLGEVDGSWGLTDHVVGLSV